MKNNEGNPGDPNERELPKCLWTINYKKCTVCCECVDACKLHLIVWEDNRVRITSQAKCNWCGDCANVCPSEAIVLT